MKKSSLADSEMRRITELPGANGEFPASEKEHTMHINLPPTKGRGKWGRKIKSKRCRRNQDHMRPITQQPCLCIEERNGRDVRVRIAAETSVARWHTPGTKRQNFYSSPGLREWFERHDAVIDARIELSARAECASLRLERKAKCCCMVSQQKAGAV